VKPETSLSTVVAARDESENAEQIAAAVRRLAERPELVRDGRKTGLHALPANTTAKILVARFEVAVTEQIRARPSPRSRYRRTRAPPSGRRRFARTFSFVLRGNG
jgi:hypothetical protein